MHSKNEIVKITKLLISTVARNSINCNLVCNTGCSGYIHDVTMTLCAPSIKMTLCALSIKMFTGFQTILLAELPDTIMVVG